MPNESDDMRDEPVFLFLSWGMPIEVREGFLDGPTLWLTGGATLLLWTALAVLLTSA